MGAEAVVDETEDEAGGAARRCVAPGMVASAVNAAVAYRHALSPVRSCLKYPSKERCVCSAPSSSATVEGDASDPVRPGPVSVEGVLFVPALPS